MKHIKEYEEFINESKEIKLILSKDEDFDRIKRILNTGSAKGLNFTKWEYGMPLGSARGRLVTMYFANSKEEVEAFINKNSINVASNFNLDEDLHEDLNATISDPEIEEAWNKVYGKDFKEDFPHIFKIMKQRAKMDSRELERIWNETHENSFKEEHPKVWNILFSDK
jgi:hypothetical protein